MGAWGSAEDRKSRPEFFLCPMNMKTWKKTKMSVVCFYSVSALYVHCILAIPIPHHCVVQLLFPWVFRGLWLAEYFILKCLARIFAGVMLFQNIHPVRSFIACTIVQCANFYPEYSIVGSCAQYFLREASSFQRIETIITQQNAFAINGLRTF